ADVDVVVVRAVGRDGPWGEQLGLGVGAVALEQLEAIREQDLPLLGEGATTRATNGRGTLAVLLQHAAVVVEVARTQLVDQAAQRQVRRRLVEAQVQRREGA